MKLLAGQAQLKASPVVSCSLKFRCYRGIRFHPASAMPHRKPETHYCHQATHKAEGWVVH